MYKYHVTSQTTQTNVKDWFSWYFGIENLKQVTSKDLIDCALDYLSNDLEAIAKLINEHMNDEINVKTTWIWNTYENIFKIGNFKFIIDSITLPFIKNE